jgi:hypothetical protein
MRKLLLKILYPRHIELSLKQVQELLESNKNLIVGGSVALYLQGYKLKRFKNWTGDIDLISIKYIDVKLDKDPQQLPSNCDFQEQGTYQGKKVDVRFDKSATHKIIFFRGYTYKVCDIDTIIQAKRSYNRTKDINDLIELGL